MAWAGLRKCDTVGWVRVCQVYLETGWRREIGRGERLCAGEVCAVLNESSRDWYGRVVEGGRGCGCVKGTV